MQSRSKLKGAGTLVMLQPKGRLGSLNGMRQFFDKTRVVFPSSSDLMDEKGLKFLDHMLS